MLLVTKVASLLILLYIDTPAISNKGLFHYYSLYGETAVPGGLHAGLCLLFLVRRNATAVLHLVQ